MRWPCRLHDSRARCAPCWTTRGTAKGLAAPRECLPANTTMSTWSAMPIGNSSRSSYRNPVGEHHERFAEMPEANPAQDRSGNSRPLQPIQTIALPLRKAILLLVHERIAGHILNTRIKLRHSPLAWKAHDECPELFLEACHPHSVQAFAVPLGHTEHALATNRHGTIRFAGPDFAHQFGLGIRSGTADRSVLHRSILGR